MGLVYFLAASWILLLAAVVADFAGLWRRGKGWRLQGIGLLIMNGLTLADSYADARGGPSPRLPLHSFTLPALVTGFALFLIGLRVQFRQPRRPRRG